MVSIVRDQMIAEQNKRAEMVRERDALNRIASGRGGSYSNQLGLTPEVRAHAIGEARRLTDALGKMPPNAGRAFRRASRERASRVKPVYPLTVVRDNGPTNGYEEMARRRRQIAAGVIRVTG